MVKRAFMSFAFVLSITFIACNSSAQDKTLNGTWVYAEQGVELGYKFTNGDFEVSVNDVPQFKGKYTKESGKITMEGILVSGDYLNRITIHKFEPKFYSEDEFISAIKPQLLEKGASEKDIGELGEFWRESLKEGVAITPCTYSVDGNTLTIIFGGYPMKLMKTQ